MLGTLATLALTGCGVNLQNVVTDGPVVSTRAIAGQVHGGVFPIQNATVRLMQTQTGTPGSYGSTAGILATATTDANGNFTFNQTYTCSSSNEYAYITVTGGHSSDLSGSTANGSIVQLGVIGTCATLAADYSTINLYVSEASTVAAAYALGNFISINANTGAGTGQQIISIGAPAKNASTSPSCTGMGSAMSCTAGGLGHAFQTAYNLVDQVNLTGALPTGAARAANPSATSIPGIVPQQMINTIANILQNCVDSLSSSSYCSTLFADATPPNGTAPTNTLQVAMNMAKYPTNNISSLYGLQSRTPYFTPDLDSAPPSFTVALFYGLTSNSTSFPYPVDVAVDAADNAFILYGSAAPSASTATGVVALNAAGAYAGAVSNNAFGYPSQMAIDIYGGVYVTNNNPTSGALLRASYNSNLTKVATLPNASGLAIDANDNVWASAANTTSNSINEYLYNSINNSNGSTAASFSTGAIGAVAGLATDGNGDIFGVTNPATGDSAAIFLNNTGTLSKPAYSATGYTTDTLSAGGGFSVAPSPYPTVVQGTQIAGAYFPLNGQLDTAGALVQNGNTLYSGPTATTTGSGAPNRSQMDGAGNVYWADHESTGLLYVYTPSSNPTTTAGTYVSLLPCYPVPDGASYTCASASSLGGSYLRGLAIDSAGSIWMAADSALGVWVEVLGLAAPTWPQLSYAQPGVEPQ